MKIFDQSGILEYKTKKSGLYLYASSRHLEKNISNQPFYLIQLIHRFDNYIEKLKVQASSYVKLTNY